MEPAQIGNTTFVRHWFDPAELKDRYVADLVSPEQAWSVDLLRQADGERLIYDGETIRLNVDNGSWVWRVTGHDVANGVVHSRWPD